MNSPYHAKTFRSLSPDFNFGKIGLSFWNLVFFGRSNTVKNTFICKVFNSKHNILFFNGFIEYW